LRLGAGRGLAFSRRAAQGCLRLEGGRQLSAVGDLFHYHLPSDRIALRPSDPRSAARLLVSAPPAGFRDCRVHDLPTLLAPGDLLVVNDCRVIPARLRGTRRRGPLCARVECTLLRELGDEWRVLARPLKRLAPEDVIEFGGGLRATVRQVGQGKANLAFNLRGDGFRAALESAGEIPLPPYIARRRPVDADDARSYQTLFAKAPGGVAAPTAGLHFDEGLLRALSDRGIATAQVTLQVGGGTFLPLRPGEPNEPEPEPGCLPEAAARQLRETRARGGRIVAVGTTSLRLLESIAAEAGEPAAWQGDVSLVIRPGHVFRAVDGLMTNFHLPGSSLLMLVCAFLGTERCRELYAHALRSDYRFYSYGDATLLLKRHPA